MRIEPPVSEPIAAGANPAASATADPLGDPNPEPFQDVRRSGASDSLDDAVEVLSSRLQPGALGRELGNALVVIIENQGISFDRSHPAS